MANCPTFDTPTILDEASASHRIRSAGRRLSALLLLMLLWLPSIAPASSLADCHIGLYRLDDGSKVDISASNAGKLRWRMTDGTTGELGKNQDGKWQSTLGWTGRPDGKSVRFSACDGGEISFDGRNGHRVEFDIVETHFRGSGVDLVGRLVMPKGRGPFPIVVLVHGSEHDSARDRYYLQRMFPSEGIGVFVYDKRGTGESEGQYSQDYLTLAVDAVAAAREARRLAGDRLLQIGYQGASQGGWVAPLAARIEPVDFVLVCFGLAVSPLEEDRSAIVLDLTRRGLGKHVAEAMEVADATERVMLSGFREGYDELASVKKKYGSEPWFDFVRGNVSFLLLQKDETEIRKLGPELLPGVPFQYDPMPVLANLDVPQLWILGGQDIDAPSAETANRLGALAAAGRPIRTVLFPHAEHGMYEFETLPDGSRVSTRQPEGYFRLMSDFVAGRTRRH